MTIIISMQHAPKLTEHIQGTYVSCNNNFWEMSLSRQRTVRLGGRFKNTYEFLNQRALKLKHLHVNQMYIFQCMEETFCVEFQREPLKFHTKYLLHSLKDTIFMKCENFKSSYIQELISVF